MGHIQYVGRNSQVRDCANIEGNAEFVSRQPSAQFIPETGYIRQGQLQLEEDVNLALGIPMTPIMMNRIHNPMQNEQALLASGIGHSNVNNNFMVNPEVHQWQSNYFQQRRMQEEHGMMQPRNGRFS